MTIHIFYITYSTSFCPRTKGFKTSHPKSNRMRVSVVPMSVRLFNDSHLWTFRETHYVCMFYYFYFVNRRPQVQTQLQIYYRLVFILSWRRLTYCLQTISLYSNLYFKVDTGISINRGKGKVTALTMLDLSAAFHTIDRDSFIRCLSTWYGISGPALHWVSSYTTERQAIKVWHCFSDMPPFSCGITKDSVLCHCFSLSIQRY